MADLAAIRAALADNLDTLTGIQVSAYMLANPTPPSIHIYPGGPAGDIEYHHAMHGGVELWPFTVEAFVPLGSDIGAQQKLDAFINSTGTQSVKLAIEADRTLGGAAQDLKVVSTGGYQTVVFEGRPPVLRAEWTVHVYATGT